MTRVHTLVSLGYNGFLSPSYHYLPWIISNSTESHPPDEVAGVIGDVGSQLCKFGYAGEDQPKHVFHSAGGLDIPLETCKDKESTNFCSSLPSVKGKRRWRTGDENIPSRSDCTEIHSISRRGSKAIERWDLWEELWAHAFERMRAEPTERPVLCVEGCQPDIARTQRTKILEVMHETFQVPASYLVDGGVLSAFSAGRATGVVCDLGYSGISVVPVVEGHALHVATKTSTRGLGWLMSKAIETLDEACPSKEFAPRYGLSTSTLSFRSFWRREVASDYIASCAVVRPYVLPDNMGAVPSPDECTYELPDGTAITVDETMRLMAETLFQEGSLASTSSYENSKEGSQTPSTADLPLDELCHSAIVSSDEDVRKELLSSILLCGGGSLIQGMPERLGWELSQRLPNSLKIKVLAGGAVERRFAAWIGGSILSCLGTFQQLWVSKSEYEEQGAERICLERFE